MACLTMLSTSTASNETESIKMNDTNMIIHRYFLVFSHFAQTGFKGVCLVVNPLFLYYAIGKPIKSIHVCFFLVRPKTKTSFGVTGDLISNGSVKNSHMLLS